MYKIKIEGGLFYENVVKSSIWYPNLQAIFDKLWGLPISKNYKLVYLGPQIAGDFGKMWVC